MKVGEIYDKMFLYDNTSENDSKFKLISNEVSKEGEESSINHLQIEKKETIKIKKCLSRNKSFVNEKKEIIDVDDENQNSDNNYDQLEKVIENINRKITDSIVVENKNNQNISLGNVKPTAKIDNISITDLTNSTQNFSEEDIKNAPTLFIQV